MKVSVNTVGEIVAVKVEGRLDTVTAPEFDKALTPYVSAQSKSAMTVDCSALEYVSSSGLRSLISLLKATKAQGRSLTLVNMPESVRTIFDMTGFSSIFKIV